MKAIFRLCLFLMIWTAHAQLLIHEDPANQGFSGHDFLGPTVLNPPLGGETFVQETGIEKALRGSDAKKCSAGFRYYEKRSEPWKEKTRGAMPEGYVRGMLQTFARSVCRADGVVKRGMVGPSLPFSGQKDTLEMFANAPGLMKLDYTEGNDKHLVNTYSILMTLGMLETSADPKQIGVDTSKATGGSKQEEAGFFQVSQDSQGFVSEAYQKLVEEYSANPDACFASTFMGAGWGVMSRLPHEQASPSEKFQHWMRACPALAAEYAALLIRKTHAHNGPLKRNELVPNASCTRMLDSLYRDLSADDSLCKRTYPSSDQGAMNEEPLLEEVEDPLASSSTDADDGSFVVSNPRPQVSPRLTIPSTLFSPIKIKKNSFGSSKFKLVPEVPPVDPVVPKLKSEEYVDELIKKKK